MKDSDIKRERDPSFSHWFTPIMPATAQAGQARSQEPRTPLGSPTVVAETQALHPSSVASHSVYWQETGLEVEAGHGPRHSDIGCGSPKQQLTLLLLNV